MVDKIYTATNARIRFRELLREAQTGPVMVVRYGKPAIVVLSKRDYDRLLTYPRATDWRELVDRAHALISKGPVNRPVLQPADVLREIREDRYA